MMQASWILWKMLVATAIAQSPAARRWMAQW